MKKFFAVLVVMLVATMGFAQIADSDVTFIQKIDLAVGAAVCGVAEYNDEIYVAGFDTQAIYKVAAPLNTTDAGVSVFADTTVPIAWGSGRGPVSVAVDQATGDVYAAGDQGTTGDVVKYNSTGTLIAQNTAATVRGGGLALFGTGVLVSEVLSGSLTYWTADLATNNGSITNSTLYCRDMVVVGNDIYAAVTNGGASNGVLKATGGDPSNLAGYTTSLWSTDTTATWNGGAGVGYYNDTTAGIEYILQGARGDTALNFIDIADGVVDLALTSTSGVDFTELTAPVDACVADIGGSEYLFVTNSDSLLVFGLYGATGINDWMMY